jgi:hypothetical protein
MARKNDGVCGNPKLIRTDLDCRAARPKFNEDAWSRAEINGDLAALGWHSLTKYFAASCLARQPRGTVSARYMWLSANQVASSVSHPPLGSHGERLRTRLPKHILL